MTKTDKKILSILLILVMLITMFNPIIVRATETTTVSPEGTIEFTDTGLYEILINHSYVDSNEDGYITEKEMEELTTLYLYLASSDTVQSLEELKYAKNLKTLYISNMTSNIKEYNLEGLSSLETFSITKCINIDEQDYKLTADNIKLPTTFFMKEYETEMAYNNTKNYAIQGFKVEKELALQKNDLYQLKSIYMQDFDKSITISNPDVSKHIVEGTLDYIEAISIGTSTITLESELIKIDILVTVAETDIPINSNPELENDSQTEARIIYDRILMSNGDLWKVTSATKAEIEDTNVSDFVYIERSRKQLYATLKNDGNLNIKAYLKNAQNDAEPVDQKNITDVKQLLSQRTSQLAYLTNGNDVYLISVNSSTNAIETTLIANSVEKAAGAFYVKDGATYYIDGTLLLEDSMDTAVGCSFAIGNNLYTIEGYETISAKQYATDFANFATQYYMPECEYYITTSGELNAIYGLSESYIYKVNIYTETEIYPLELGYDNTIRRYSLEFLTNVKEFNEIYFDEDASIPTIIALRTDGTVWAKDCSNQYSNFEKVTFVEETTEEVKPGNVDGEGEVNIRDVRLALQYSLSKTELTEVQIQAADVNKDGIVNIKDVRLILLYSLQKIDSFENV